MGMKLGWTSTDSHPRTLLLTHPSLHATTDENGMRTIGGSRKNEF